MISKRLYRIPKLRRPIIRLWNTYEHILFVRSTRQNLSTESVTAYINPLVIHNISPNVIKDMSSSYFDFIVDTGKIINGSWDLNPQLVKDSSRYNMFKDHFLNKKNWEDIPHYNRTKNKIINGEHNRYEKLEEYEEKLATYTRIYDQFRSGSYLSQSELAAKNKNHLPGDGGETLFPSLTNHTLLRHEIAVNIGRDGTFLANDGRHRLALAVLAGLDSIPVRIVVRHREWQFLRDEIAETISEVENNTSTRELKSHVKNSLSEELENVKGGINHPDFEIIFTQRANNYVSKSTQPEQSIPYIDTGL